MNEPTRRGVLTSAVVLLGMGAGCNAFDGDETMDPTQTPSADDGEREPNGDQTTRSQADSGAEEPRGPPGELIVRNSVADLPAQPDGASFAVTPGGIFQFDGDAGSWRPVRYGTEALPAPGVDARQVTVGTSPSNRPLISNGNRTVYVDPDGGDDAADGTEDAPVATIQEAVRRVPIYLRDRFVVDLATAADTPVNYGEDVLVPSFVATGQAGQELEAEEPGPFINFVILGDQGNPGDVDIGSLTFGNVLGTAAGNLYHATVSRDSPYDDEGYGVSAYGDGEVKLYNVAFTDGPTNGVLAYGARMKARRLDFGQRNVGVGVKAKRHASVIVHNSVGELRRDGFRATGNSTISVVRRSSVTGSPMYNTLRGGLIYNADADTWIGLGGNTEVSSGRASQSSSSSSVGTHTDHPDGASPGEIWYVDGSGDLDEGFYGQTVDGPRKIG